MFKLLVGLLIFASGLMFMANLPSAVEVSSGFEPNQFDLVYWLLVGFILSVLIATGFDDA